MNKWDTLNTNKEDEDDRDDHNDDVDDDDENDDDDDEAEKSFPGNQDPKPKREISERKESRKREIRWSLCDWR